MSGSRDNEEIRIEPEENITRPRREPNIHCLCQEFSCQDALGTLGIEPRAFHVRSGCDTTTPCDRGSS